MRFFPNLILGGYRSFHPLEHAADKVYSGSVIIQIALNAGGDDFGDALAAVDFFNTACYYLHQLLSRASHSPELVALIQSGHFQNTYGKNIFPPKHSKVTNNYDRAVIAQVVQACDAYITVGDLFSRCRHDRTDLSQRVVPIKRWTYYDLLNGVRFAPVL
jgi:hypothetical protein